MTLSEQFQDATVRVKTLSSKPGNQELLDLYSLYKQATEGDVSGEKPGMFDFVAAAKFAAWEKLQGTSKDTAMEKYIAYVDGLLKAQ